MKISSKRAEYVAVASLIVSVVFFGITFLVGRWSGFLAVSAIGWFALGAALVWFVLLIQFHQRSLAEQEKLDTAQLTKDKKSATIFEDKGERVILFAVAQHRLQILEKWFLPIFSVLIAVYHIVIGLYLLRAVSAPLEIEPKQPLVCAVSLVAIAFVSFLMSRYATGMSVQQQWKPLRAGGSFLLGVAVLSFLLAVALALDHFNIAVVLSVIGWLIPVILIALGAETFLNVVLDIYRPRLKGQYSRTAFDSRILGIINEPGGIVRKASDAVDYQFGFEVSQTWFYKLLEKAIVPLVLFAILTLYLLSCVVIIAPDEQAVIEHFGSPLTEDGQKRIAGPGLSFKWPWPIDIAYKYPVKKIMRLNIGFTPKINPKTGHSEHNKPRLWGKAHYHEEFELLVASEQTTEKTTGAVPVSIIVAAVPVQYRVKDLYSFIYEHSEPQKLLEFICYRELINFAAGAKIEVDTEAGLESSLLGAGRAEAKRILTERMQNAADEENLGVEITFVGLQGLHPPLDVAPAYQEVAGAIQKKQAIVLIAHAQRNKILSSLAGSVEEADKLYELTARYQQQS